MCQRYFDQLSIPEIPQPTIWLIGQRNGTYSLVKRETFQTEPLPLAGPTTTPSSLGKGSGWVTLAWTTYTCGSRVVFWRAGKHLWAQVKADVTDLFTWQRCECASELPGAASQIQHDADAAEPIGDEGKVYSQGVGADLSRGVTAQLPSETYDNPCELCLCFSRTTQDVTRIKQDTWLNPEGRVMQLSL
jgi:hypothetical protein